MLLFCGYVLLSPSGQIGSIACKPDILIQQTIYILSSKITTSTVLFMSIDFIDCNLGNIST
jgi:hypothetical protein